jgi:hypothetical protein
MTDLGGVYLSSAARLENRWTDVFKRDTAIHLGIMASITVATFQGYLKDRIAGPLPYVLSELFFIGAFIVWFATIAIRHVPIRGPGIVPAAVLTAVFVPVLYLIHPGAPLAVEIAGLRAWAEFPVACLIALTVIRNPGQVRAYVGLILALGVVTALFGIWQYQAGPEDVLGISDLARDRHGATVFYVIPGLGLQDFRAFSTFTFPAPFAGFMVFGILLAGGIALSGFRSRRRRILATLLIPLYFAGVTVSGTRASFIVLLLGLLVLGYYRGLGLRMFALLPVLLLAVYGGALLTAGRVFARFQSILLQEGLLWRYVYSPVAIAVNTLGEFPFGMGLGRSGVGVPYTIFRSYPQGYFRGSDGDIGRAAVEMGVFGVILLVVIVVALLPHAARAMRHLVGSHAEDVALGSGALIISTGVLLLIGSPLSSVPHATIWWFLLGALLKLSMIRRDEEQAAASG